MAKYELYYSAETDAGLRGNNEDSICALALDDLFVFAVADGMGGMDAGEVASEIAINAIVDCVKESIESIVKGRKTLKEIIRYSFLVAQTNIADDIVENPARSSMGTTLTMVLIYKGRYAIGNIGDSRIYLRRRGKLKLLTMDHSYVFEEQKKKGKNLSESMIKNYGHLVTKAVDGKNITPDLFPKRRKSYKLKNRDGLLLCSDGLITADVFNDSTKIQAAINTCNYIDDVSRTLIKSAMENGSNDNISVIYLSQKSKVK
ncbi:PP2C family protein-serine/threonine phosphatase [Carboxylicivirga caseinilyticus]|uniref:PP2C family protein-serine/threonine phosphatase n=1 Tax=Carboxylicivirga caseinilyticus TaxID=3417572 RepID=UPI003D32A26E|nr:serine/threonine-protein phosphatase [Marinilabiliaceae bacterium A049]